MGFEEDAIAIARGARSVVDSANVLEIAEANQRQPIAVAAHWAGEYCVVLFITKQTDGFWRTDVVPVKDDDVDWSAGSTGGLRRRSEVERGSPMIDGETRLAVDDAIQLLQIEGVSADDRVRLRHGTEIVAETVVAPHGHFVLAALVPADAQVTVEAA